MSTFHDYRRHWKSWICFVFVGGIIFFLSSRVEACQTPVFRYALEKWPPENFRLVIFHRGPMSEAEKKLSDGLEAFRKTPGAPPNLIVYWSDIEKMQDPILKKIWESQRDVKLPWAVLCYPGRSELKTIWSGMAEANMLQNLLDSPARQDIAKKIISGGSAIWVMLEGGNASKDKAAFKLLSENLKTLEKELKLPEDSQEAVAAGMTTPDDQIKISFPLIQIQRTDFREAGFIKILEAGLETKPQAGEPVVIPVFGQGRALTGLFGKDLSKKAIAEVCEFLLGPCSCVVKEQNPGYDLLIMSDWYLSEHVSVKLPSLAALAGVPEAKMPVAVSADSGLFGKPMRFLIFTGVALILIVGITTFLIRRKSS